MSQVKTIFKNTSWLMTSQIITSICGFVWTILIARYLGTSDFGILSFAISITGIGNVFMDLGMSTYIVRDVSNRHERASEYLGKIIPLKLLLSVIVTLVILLILNIMGYGYLTLEVTLLIAIETIFVSLNGLFNGMFQAFEKIEYQSKGTILNSILLLSIVLISIYFNFGLIGVSLAYLIPSTIAFLYYYTSLNKNITSPNYEIDFDFCKKIIKYSIPFGLTGIFYSIYFTIDMTMLGFLATNIDIGLYNASYKIISMLTAFYVIYPSVIFPVMSKLYESSGDLLKLSYEKSIKYLLLIVLPISVGVFVYAHPLVTLIYGNEYILSGSVMQVLVWTIPFLFINGSSGLVLNSSHKEVAVTKIYGIAALLNVVLNFIMIPSMSYMGAAYATVISEVVICVLMYYSISKTPYHPNRKTAFDVIKISVVSVVMGVILSYFNISMFVGIAVGGAIYGIGCIVIHIIDSDDKFIIKEILGKN